MKQKLQATLNAIGLGIICIGYTVAKGSVTSVTCARWGIILQEWD